MKKKPYNLMTIISLSFLFFVLFSSNISAQNDDKNDKKEVHIKIIHSINDDASIIDTTIFLDSINEEISNTINSLLFIKEIGDDLEEILKNIVINLVIDVVFSGKVQNIEKIINMDHGMIIVDDDTLTKIDFDLDINIDDNDSTDKVIVVKHKASNIKGEEYKKNKVKIITTYNDNGETQIKVIELNNDDANILEDKLFELENSATKTQTFIIKNINKDDKDIPKNIKVKNNLNSDQISVYPNPTDGNVDISVTLPTNEQIKIEVFDINGKLLINKQEIPNNNVVKTELNLNDYNKGTYFLKISQKNKSHIQKVIIK